MHLLGVLAEVLDAGAAVDGRGAGLDDHGERLALARAGVLHGRLPVRRGAEEAPLHVPQAPVLVRRLERVRQLGQPAEAAEQLQAGREPHHARDLHDGRLEHEDGGGEQVPPLLELLEVPRRKPTEDRVVHLEHRSGIQHLRASRQPDSMWSVHEHVQEACPCRRVNKVCLCKLE